MYNRDRDAQAVLFYHTACMQLLQWCQADADNMASRMQEVNLYLLLRQLLCALSNVIHKTWVQKSMSLHSSSSIYVCGLLS